MDYSLPGSSVHGILQARILEWVGSHSLLQGIFPIKESNPTMYKMELPGWFSGKEYTCHAGDSDSFPGSGRSSGEGNVTNSRILVWEIPWTEEPGGL